MKKTAFFILMFTFAATLAHSQVLIALLFGDKLTSEKFQLGINLAGNWQNVTGWEGTKNRFSIRVELLSRKPIIVPLSREYQVSPRAQDLRVSENP